MKRIFTLSLVMLFACMSVMAQIALGDAKFSLGDGKKISPTTGKILVTFPDATGVEETAGFVMSGSFGVEGTEWDGIEGTIASGYTFDLQEFELLPSTNYTLTISSVKVDGVECAPEGGYKLNFVTRGAERKMAWSFEVPEEEMAIIRADADADNGGAQAYWSPVKANERYYIKQSLKYDEIMLDANNVLSVTEDLAFNFGSEKAYIGDPTNSSWKGILCFNNNNMQMTIPDCRVGDIITFNAVQATKPSSSKFPIIQAMNGGAIAPEGLVSSTGLQDSINIGGSYANYKFEIQVDGDVTFNFGQARLKSINIEEGQPKVARNYNVVAAYTDGDNNVVLKELVAKTEGTTGSTIKVDYPYWLVNAEGTAYTHGAKGTPFVESFDLKNNGGENEDTTFVVSYKKTDFTGVVYLSEGEDIENAVPCTHANAAIRSSMCKAGYVIEDTKLVTLQPGTYKIRAVLFDANGTASYQCVLSKGEGEENEIYLVATATNWTETESVLLTITEPTDITLKGIGGSENKGLDVIMIYASTDAPDDPDGIVVAKAADEKAAVRKVAKNGQILIQTAAGTFNAVGAQVK